MIKIKKILSVVLTLTMVLSLSSVGSFAQESNLNKVEKNIYDPIEILKTFDDCNIIEENSRDTKIELSTGDYAIYEKKPLDRLH